jgi:hypothetical protein
VYPVFFERKRASIKVTGGRVIAKLTTGRRTKVVTAGSFYNRRKAGGSLGRILKNAKAPG